MNKTDLIKAIQSRRMDILKNKLYTYNECLIRSSMLDWVLEVIKTYPDGPEERLEKLLMTQHELIETKDRQINQLLKEINHIRSEVQTFVYNDKTYAIIDGKAILL